MEICSAKLSRLKSLALSLNANHVIDGERGWPQPTVSYTYQHTLCMIWMGMDTGIVRCVFLEPKLFSLALQDRSPQRSVNKCLVDICFPPHNQTLYESTLITKSKTESC